MSGSSPDIERRDEGVVRVVTPGVHRHVRRTGSPIPNIIYGKQEEEATGSKPLDYQVARR